MRRENLFSGIYPREKYLARIRPFYDSDIVKVITGIRRCGKSFILRSVMNEIAANGLPASRIIYLPLEQRGYKGIRTPEDLEELIAARLSDDVAHYLFLDEIQNVRGFESVVAAYAAEGHSIFMIGSNSYLLSDEISTRLTGRYLSFEVFPLDFREYLEMKQFRRRSIDPDVYAEFDEYVRNGGFPKSLEFEDLNARQTYSEGIISEIIKKDVRSRRKITNLALFERIQSFLISNYAATFSLAGLMEGLKKEGFAAKAATVRGYIEELRMAKIVSECNRFDLKSRKALKREQKYYLTDLAIYFALNTDNRISYGSSLENLVYVYLVSNGYQVSIGKIGRLECDFIVRDRMQGYAYIQVAYTLHAEDPEATQRLREREYRPFRDIRDGYPRYIVSLDRHRDQQEGVIHISAVDLFLGKVSIGRSLILNP